MKTHRPEKCSCCGEWRILIWSTAPIRKLCEDCHRGIVMESDRV